MPLLIDGNNLIGAIPYLNLEDDDAKDKLIAIIRAYQAKKKNNIILFFDGFSPHRPRVEKINRKFTIRYPKFEEQNADNEIKRQLDSYNDFRNVILITSDRDLKDYAKARKARIINSVEFYHTIKHYYRVEGKNLEQNQRIHRELSDSEIDQWMQLFGDK
jgi:predicted RNA-binding protein with PIN domain